MHGRTDHTLKEVGGEVGTRRRDGDRVQQSSADEEPSWLAALETAEAEPVSGGRTARKAVLKAGGAASPVPKPSIRVAPKIRGR